MMYYILIGFGILILTFMIIVETLGIRKLRKTFVKPFKIYKKYSPNIKRTYPLKGEYQSLINYYKQFDVRSLENLLIELILEQKDAETSPSFLKNIISYTLPAMAILISILTIFAKNVDPETLFNTIKYVLLFLIALMIFVSAEAIFRNLKLRTQLSQLNFGR